MFGSREREALQGQVEALQQQIADLQARHESDGRTIATYEETTTSNRRMIDELWDDAEKGKVATEIGRYALQELRKAESSGEIMISAKDTAREVVTKRLIDQTTAEQTNQLIDASVSSVKTLDLMKLNILERTSTRHLKGTAPIHG